MKTFQLEMNAMELVVESREVSLTVNIGELPHDILRQIIPHGIKQKLADAAASVPFTCYMASKPEGAAKPSRDQLADFVAANKMTVDAGILAAMQKAWDAMVAGQWQVRVASGGTVSKWTDEQSLALDIAKGALQAIFAAALAKASPGTKPNATAFVGLSPKVAAFFKSGESVKRPTWEDKAVMEWIKRQHETKARDFMTEAREELARREAASVGMTDDLDTMLGDI
jgi:hypothetical protein